METCDDEFVAAASDFIKRQHAAGTPFFCWVNITHMHLRTHTKPESVGQAGRWQSQYHDTMIDHDKNVGAVLDLLDELGIADDTIVMYSTDNGPHMNTWPDGAMTPFRSEKNTNWEGAFRVPLLDPLAGQDRRRARLERDRAASRLAADVPRRGGRAATSTRSSSRATTAAGKTFKVHIDGYNLLPYLTGEEEKSPREGFIYFSDDGDLVALRFDNWKLVFMEQRSPGTLAAVGGAVHAAAGPEALQPAHRSVRARRHHVEHLLGLVHEQGLHDHGRAGARRRVPRDVQGLPAAAEGRQLHDRPDPGEDGGRRKRRPLTRPRQF